MESEESLVTSMVNSDGSINPDGSTRWLDDAATLNDSAKQGQRTSIAEAEKTPIADPGKAPEITPRPRSQASYIEDPEVQAPSPVQEQSSDSPKGPVKVPRSRRRGWFAKLVIIPEVEEPKDYERRTKWIITFIIAIGGIAAPFGSSIIFRMITARPLAENLGMLT